MEHHQLDSFRNARVDVRRSMPTECGVVEDEIDAEWF
jgi:hypothetical protein